MYRKGKAEDKEERSHPSLQAELGQQDGIPAVGTVVD